MTSVGFQLMEAGAAESGLILVQMSVASCNSNTRLDPMLLKDLLKFSEIFALPAMHKGASNQV